MKSALILFVFHLFISNLEAQPLAEFRDSLKVDEPEFLGNALWINGTEITPLEKQSPYLNPKLGNGKNYLSIGGGISSVRMPQTEVTYLLVKVGNNNIDPSSIVNLFRFDFYKGKRTVHATQISPVGRASNNGKTDIPFQAVKYGQSSYLLAIEGSLPKGEFGIFIQDENINYISAFGIGESNYAEDGGLLGSTQPAEASVFVPKRKYFGVWKSPQNGSELFILPQGDRFQITYKFPGGDEVQWIAEFKKGDLIDQKSKKPFIRYQSASNSMAFAGQEFIVQEKLDPSSANDAFYWGENGDVKPRGGAKYVSRTKYIGNWQSRQDNSTLSIYRNEEQFQILFTNSDSLSISWNAEFKKGYLIDLALKNPFIALSSGSQRLYFRKMEYRRSN